MRINVRIIQIILLAVAFITFLTMSVLSALMFRQLSIIGDESKSGTSGLADTVFSEEKKVVTVYSAQEFIDAVAPNTKIIVDCEQINLANVRVGSEYVVLESKYDYINDTSGKNIVIKFVDNLEITGNGSRKTEIATPNTYANVLSFRGCKNIKINGIKMGHLAEPGSCSGGVLNFYGVDGIILEDCYLYGSGINGINASYCKNIIFTRSTISDCSYSIMELNGCDNIAFYYSNFSDCGSGLTIQNCTKTAFFGSVFRNNNGNYLYTDDWNSVNFENCAFYDDTSSYPYDNPYRGALCGAAGPFSERRIGQACL